MTILKEIYKAEAEDAFNKVRHELWEVGLLEDGVYLDEVDLVVSAIPSLGEAGYVFDRGLPFFAKMVGYQPGVIYLPSNIPHEQYVPGGTLVDVIRHEFAHAWAWLDRDFMNQDWFVKAFHKPYEESCDFENGVYKLMRRMVSPETGESIGRLYFDKYGFRNDYFSEYAMSAVYEDFAETFMCYLRYRKSLNRFKSRPGLYRKLKAVEQAVSRKANELSE